MIDDILFLHACPRDVCEASGLDLTFATQLIPAREANVESRTPLNDDICARSGESGIRKYASDTRRSEGWTRITIRMARRVRHSKCRLVLPALRAGHGRSAQALPARPSRRSSGPDRSLHPGRLVECGSGVSPQSAYDKLAGGKPAPKPSNLRGRRGRATHCPSFSEGFVKSEQICAQLLGGPRIHLMFARHESKETQWPPKCPRRN